MPWWSGLAPAERLRLLELGFPTPDDAAAWVIEHPDYSERCEQLGFRVKTHATTEHRGRHDPARIVVPQEHEAVLLYLVRKALLEGDEPGEDMEDGRAPAVGRARPPLPNETQLGSFAHGTIERAVKKFDHDATKGEVVSGTDLSPQDARRVRLMFVERLLRLNNAKKLVLDPRVARKDARIVLRYLDESGSRWLDPNVELRGR